MNRSESRRNRVNVFDVVATAILMYLGAAIVKMGEMKDRASHGLRALIGRTDKDDVRIT